MAIKTFSLATLSTFFGLMFLIINSDLVSQKSGPSEHIQNATQYSFAVIGLSQSKFNDIDDIPIEGKTLKTTGQLSDPVSYQELSWSPDGRQIVFTANKNKNWDIYAMNANGSDIKRLTDDPANDSYASWSPDATKIAFASNRSGKFAIYVKDLKGSRMVRLTNGKVDCAFPAWSPNGRKMAFMSKRTNGTWQIYVMNADGTREKRLTNNKANDYNPAWSPDASMIAFESDRDGNDLDEIYTIGINGRNERRVTNNNAENINDVFPTWVTIDQISISAVKDRRVDVFIMSKEGSNRRLLIERASYGRWSPDRSKIAFISQSDKDKPSQIYVMNADGSGKTQLTK